MDHKRLDIWKLSVELVTKVYQVTENFPQHEQFGLTSQIRRSAVSVPSNIAEGHSRKAQVDFSRFLRIALGSSSELETQLIIANNLGYLNNDELKELSESCLATQKMLRKLISSLAT